MNECKNLGLTTDKTLDKIYLKCNYKNSANGERYRVLYVKMSPHFRYLILSRGNVNQHLLNKLPRIQNKAVKLYVDSSSNTNIYKYTKILDIKAIELVKLIDSIKTILK